MKIGSLCTGYGGLDLAVEAYFNGKTVWCAEIDKAASKVIQERLEVPNLGDLKTINWSNVESIDILTAGYPCQPFSHAGERKGLQDERHLFPYIAQAISTLRPRFVILENVRGHLSLGLKEVLSILATIGYDAKWQIVRASDVGAPHQRARLFIIAYPNSLNRRISLPDVEITNSNDHRCDPWFTCRFEEKVPRTEGDGFITNSNGDTHEESRRTTSCLHSKSYGLSNWKDKGQTRNEHRFSREMDRQSVPDTLDQGKLNPVFVEYMMGLPKGWITDLNLSRTEQLKMLGNGVVPQQAFRALELLCENDYE